VSQKRGLGRGLGALLGDAPTTDVTTAPPRGLTQIAITRITPNPNQPRMTFDPKALDELRASIAEFGVLVPIIVRPSGANYELIAGERRWRAATMAQLETIPAIVRAADERESLEVAIIENLQRENLDPLEEAMGIAHLIETYAYTQERVAERLGRSRPAIANALRLLTLPDRVKALVRSGALTTGHAKAILAFPAERREAAAERAAREGMTVRALEALAQAAAPAAKRTKRAGASPAHDPGEHADLLERLRYKFATHVALVPRERGGAIELRYADANDLMRIADVLLGEEPAV
jgi:ParB family chromosome partitioning protein